MNADTVQEWIRGELARLEVKELRNALLGFNGETVCLSGWARKPGDEKETYLTFVGYSVEETLKSFRDTIPGRDTLAARLRDRAKELLREAKQLEDAQ